MRTKEEMINLVDETVEYYKTHYRGSTAVGSCAYEIILLKGECNERVKARCAVGRVLKEEAQAEIKKLGIEAVDVGNLMSAFRGDEEALFQEGYTDYPEWLWDRLQTLHDSQNNWIESEEEGKLNVLTKIGEEVVEFIKGEIKFKSK
jgi:phage host-nuclease inhibitor protein Gam